VAKTGRFTEYRLTKSKKRFLGLGYEEWCLLPPHLRGVHRNHTEYEARYQREQRGTLNPIQEREYVNKIESHWSEVVAILRGLQGIDAFPPDPRELRQWFSWPTPGLERPGPGGMLRRECDGSISFKLTAEGLDHWHSLEEHLASSPLLTAIGQWKKSMCQDIESRWVLFEALVKAAEGRTGLQLWVSVNEGDIKEKGLHNHYIDSLYDQTFRRATGLSAYPIGREYFRVTSGGYLYLYDYLMALGCDDEQRDRAINFLLEEPVRLAETSTAKAAGEAYRQAINTTRELKNALARFLSLTGRTPDTRCHVCRPWVEALGVRHERPS